MPQTPSPVEITRAYHERTKHLPGRWAASLGYLDWATQPDPFRRFAGAPTHALDLIPVEESAGVRYEPAFLRAGLPIAAACDRRAISQLFQDSLGLSAWKQAGTSRWALRVNPSSGNLHPTEGYLVAGPIAGLHDRAAVYHYAPRDHLLERRADLTHAAWSALGGQLPDGAVLVGLSSIHWREAWKYGERSFRYCQHDVGHAVAAVAIAAGGLGWEARLLEQVIDPDLRLLLGLHLQSGIEAEHADCLIALFPRPSVVDEEDAEILRRTDRFTVAGSVLVELLGAAWLGVPNTLSSDHEDWPVIQDVAAATEKHVAPPPDFAAAPTFDNTSLVDSGSPLLLRPLLHQRRSAVSLDGHTGITADTFHQILLKTLPGRGQIPLAALPWRPCIDLLLFVHRVVGVPAGLYVLPRDPTRADELRAALDPRFVWTRPDPCPPSLPLFLLEAGDARRVASQTSCGQEIAGDGAFAVAMLADYRAPLEHYGAWMYPRLHWEAGAVGQVLYLEAEASGIRATGIGCFFDDLTHRTFGVSDNRHQVVYHLTMGGPVDDERIQTSPPYEHLRR